MSTGLTDIISALDALAAYAGPWRVLREETPLLGARLAELRERESRLDDVLLVALVGGSGVGKSTLLNALAGDQIAETSEMRPCTSTPTVYHPPGMHSSLGHLTDVRHVARSALDNIALIDTPDSDTIVKEHRRIVEQVLGECDLILMCADSEKYLDEATWSLLEPLRGMRAIACVQTRVARIDNAIREDWLQRLDAWGFKIEQFFQVNALHGLDRKLAGTAPDAREHDFPALESYLRHELDKDRVRRIKTSNAAGLLAVTVNRLHERVHAERQRIDALEHGLIEHDVALAQATLRYFGAGVTAEPHLWVQALGREVSVRAKGGVGTLYKLLELFRSLPYRMPVWLTLDFSRREAEAGARSLFAFSADGGADASLPEALSSQHEAARSELRMRFIRSGFDMNPEAGMEGFGGELNRRVRGVFGGPVHELLTRRARWLTAWPVTLLLDGVPVATILYAAYLMLGAFWRGELFTATPAVHAGTVLFLTVIIELFALSTAVRVFAWDVRRQGLRALKSALAAPGLAFNTEKALLAEVRQLLQAIDSLRDDVSGH